MSQLEELVRFNAANSGLAFREHAYARDEEAELARDVLAKRECRRRGAALLISRCA